MTTVAQMIEWMKTLPQDAEVECGVERTRARETWMEFKPVNIKECHVYDYSDEKYREMYPNMSSTCLVKLCGE